MLGGNRCSTREAVILISVLLVSCLTVVAQAAPAENSHMAGNEPGTFLLGTRQLGLAAS